MATVLCVWELGSELGHWSKLRVPIVTALRMGHRVFVVARQLNHATDFLGDLPVTYLQAPFRQITRVADQSAFLGYAHLLAHQCFSGVDELAMNVRAWRSIFDLVLPDIVWFEHSPTALIASRSYHFRKVVFGAGFFVPPRPASPSAPFAPFATTARTPEVLEGLHADDRVVLQVVNQALARLGTDGFAALADIYAQADRELLMTWPELDHFGARPDARYMGDAPPLARAAPQWPPGPGPKVFGYLQNMPGLEVLLRDLATARVCTLLFVRDLPRKLRDVYSGDQLRFSDKMVDLAGVARQAAWVINHANHATVATFMLEGIPQLVIPRHQEQLFLALRLVGHGCARMGFQDQAGFLKEITALCADPSLQQQATRLQQQCTPRDVLDLEGAMRQTYVELLH